MSTTRPAAAAAAQPSSAALVIDADGVPLGLGRTERLFTRERRRAVIARDRECIGADCHLPARWCEVHHIRWWERDAGPTSLDNAASLCAFHHHEVHRRDLAIARRAAPPEPAATGRRGRRHEVAPVTYELRDRAGRLVADAPGAPGGRPGALPSLEIHAPDGPDPGLRWTADEFTGIRVPLLP